MVNAAALHYTFPELQVTYMYRLIRCRNTYYSVTLPCMMAQNRISNASTTRLVDTLEWRDRLALVLVEGSVDDATVLDLHVRRRRRVLPSKGVLHPFLIITL